MARYVLDLKPRDHIGIVELQSLKWLPVEYRMKQQKRQFMHKIIYRQKPARLAKKIKFVSQVHEHETCAQGK